MSEEAALRRASDLAESQTPTSLAAPASTLGYYSHAAPWYPTRAQELALARWFDHSRWVWNWGLESRRKAYARRNETLGSVDLGKRLTQLKKAPSLAWLGDVAADCLNQKLRDLDTAFKNFFEGRAGFPRFKSRHGPQSARVIFDHRHAGKVRAWTSGTNDRPGHHLVLPQIGAVQGARSSQVIDRAAASALDFEKEPACPTFITRH